MNSICLGQNKRIVSEEIAEVAVNQKLSQRIVSVDILRGFDMFWLIGGEYIFKKASVLISPEVKDFVHMQLSHARWEGFRFL